MSVLHPCLSPLISTWFILLCITQTTLWLESSLLLCSPWSTYSSIFLIPFAVQSIIPPSSAPYSVWFNCMASLYHGLISIGPCVKYLHSSSSCFSLILFQRIPIQKQNANFNYIPMKINILFHHGKVDEICVMHSFNFLSQTMTDFTWCII